MANVGVLAPPKSSFVSDYKVNPPKKITVNPIEICDSTFLGGAGLKTPCLYMVSVSTAGIATQQQCTEEMP